MAHDSQTKPKGQTTINKSRESGRRNLGRIRGLGMNRTRRALVDSNKVTGWDSRKIPNAADSPERDSFLVCSDKYTQGCFVSEGSRVNRQCRLCSVVLSVKIL